MKLKSFLVSALLLYTVSAHAEYKFAENWNWKDTVLEGTFVTLTVIDWGQTRGIALHPNQYRETNPLLGSHPSITKVDTFIPAGIIIHGVISMALPPKYRAYWQAVWIGVEGGAVWHNANLGLKINF